MLVRERSSLDLNNKMFQIIVSTLDRRGHTSLAQRFHAKKRGNEAGVFSQAPGGKTKWPQVVPGKAKVGY